MATCFNFCKKKQIKIIQQIKISKKATIFFVKNRNKLQPDEKGLANTQMVGKEKKFWKPKISFNKISHGTGKPAAPILGRWVIHILFYFKFKLN